MQKKLFTLIAEHRLCSFLGRAEQAVNPSFLVLMERKQGLAGTAGCGSGDPDLLPPCPSASPVESRASESPALSEVQEEKLIKKVVRS